MNKHLNALAVTLLTTSCFSLPLLAQETQPTKPRTPWKSRLPSGQFTITPSTPEGSFAVEANGAPLESVLQAVAQQVNRQIIISDEAQELLDRTTIALDGARSFTPDQMLEMFTAGSFSWGKVGQGAYLLVVRQKSAVEIASENTKNKQFFLPQPKAPEAIPQEPKQAQPKGRMYLLSPKTK